jgi:hypothetical protein
MKAGVSIIILNASKKNYNVSPARKLKSLSYLCKCNIKTTEKTTSATMKAEESSVKRKKNNN